VIDVGDWRVALRIARRSLRRNMGRSLLVAILVHAIQQQRSWAVVGV
jgi:hypothetical protein